MNTHHRVGTVFAKRAHTIFLPGIALLLGISLSGELAAHGNTPPSLTGVEMPPTPGLLDGTDPIVINKTTAIQLGKALFWDTHVGSDGMACASCHFHAGVDGRFKNQLATGKLHRGATTRLSFEATASGGSGGPNYTLKRGDFPLHQLADPRDKDSAVVFTTDDIVSSAGVFLARFNGLGQGNTGLDECISKTDDIFHLGTLNTRQVQARQAPSVINAGFNFRNFWDGRANNIFNGVSPFGLRDPDAGIWVVQADGTVSKQAIQLENASLASQAVAPAVNNSEMSCKQRAFPDIARKLLSSRPLLAQEIHPEDSVLAGLRDVSGKGLDTSYEALVKASFAPRYWSGAGEFGQPADKKAAPYNQMEANFSLFFGLALQLYQQTLISDQTPFDTPRLPGKIPQMPEGLNKQQKRGLVLFLNAHCAICHSGPTLSAAAHPLINFITPHSGVKSAADAFSSLRLVNRKTLNGSFTGHGTVNGMLDEGFFNTSVTPTNNDPGVGGKDPYGNPLSFSQQYFNQLLNGTPMVDPVAVNSCDLDNPFTQDYLDRELIDDPYIVGNCGTRGIYAKIPSVPVLQAELKKLQQGRALLAIKGAFKAPSLRNVELTGPYMHNGSLLTLDQVVDFYFRGGNFKNSHHFATLVFQQPISDSEKADLVAFLKSLTDERVRWERAPFDHPQIVIPHGHKESANLQHPELAADLFLKVPAVGKNGRDAALGPLKPFDSFLRN
ncbi:MAG: cytochrome c peroxidase [Methylovulum sp.]|uniref:cytochrome-c peroxidase n=1 Tax=Methylovulum sp. TaxID=1916980 RepID=UPI0026205634|nr:cytochrome c peroxidase [Methylovulum sp.]MDD2723731.1 cytochrome c peroxidase [Methylovulum sp.]MDD5125348.1 cytochrome c peroxidase [Methylovulum sp.]